MLIRTAELTHALDKFEFTTMEFESGAFGAMEFGEIQSRETGPLRRLRGSWPISSQQLECDRLAPLSTVHLKGQSQLSISLELR